MAKKTGMPKKYTIWVNSLNLEAIKLPITGSAMKENRRYHEKINDK